MYILKVKKSPDFDDEEERYRSDVNDIVISIADKLLDVDIDAIEVKGDEILFNSDLTEKNIKKLLKGVFSFHFENVRFVSLNKI